jgi:hypothetical protein
MAYRNLMVPHFLDETMGKPMGHGSRAFLHNVNLIWTKRIHHIYLFFKIILPKKNLEMWVA